MFHVMRLIILWVYDSYYRYNIFIIMSRLMICKDFDKINQSSIKICNNKNKTILSFIDERNYYYFIYVSNLLLFELHLQSKE